MKISKTLQRSLLITLAFVTILAALTELELI